MMAALMRSFAKDWARWSRAERVGAGLVLLAAAAVLAARAVAVTL